jgi:hypothetical protein
MPAGLVVKVNNFGFDLTFTIQNADGTIRDLTDFFAPNGTTTLYVYTQEQTPTLLFSGPCNSITPTTGICTYSVVSTNLSQIGTFDAELEMITLVTPVPPPILPPVTTFLEDTETFSFNIIPRHPIP